MEAHIVKHCLEDRLKWDEISNVIAFVLSSCVEIRQLMGDVELEGFALFCLNREENQFFRDFLSKFRAIPSFGLGETFLD